MKSDGSLKQISKGRRSWWRTYPALSCGTHLCFTILETWPAQDSVGPRKHIGSVRNANRPERPLSPFKPEFVLLFNWQVKIIYIYGVQLDPLMCLHCEITKSSYSTCALPYIFCHLFMARTLKIYSLRNQHALNAESRQWYPKKLEWPRNPGPTIYFLHKGITSLN